MDKLKNENKTKQKYKPKSKLSSHLERHLPVALGFPFTISGLLYLDATSNSAGNFQCCEQQMMYYTERH